MHVRICPLCDSEMKKAHYCDVCHSVVWKPQVLDIHYNVDGRGKNAVDCSYGEEHDAYHHVNTKQESAYRTQKSSTVYGKSTVKGKNIGKTGSYQEIYGDLNTNQTEEKKTAGKKKKGGLGWIIVLVALLNLVGTSESDFFAEIRALFTEESEVVYEHDNEIFELSEYETVSEREMSSYTECCNSASHLGVTVDEWELYCRTNIEDLQLLSEEVSNYRAVDDEGIEVTYFATNRVYTGDDGTTVYVEFDSVTGNLHYVDADKVHVYTALVLCGAVSEEFMNSVYDTVYEEVNNMDSGDATRFYYEDLVLYVSVDKTGMLFISIDSE